MLPGFKPVAALVILSGVAFGGETGFLVGAMSMLTSNVLFGQGPWTPFQMFAMGLIGFLAGVSFQKGLLRAGRAPLAIFGAVSVVLVYGGIMNPASAILYQPNLSLSVLKAYYLTGFPSIWSTRQRQRCFSGSARSRCWRSSSASNANMG